MNPPNLSKMKSPNLAFITCIEKGYLEGQSLLLYESIRQYGGAVKDCSIYAVCPREGKTVSPETQKALDRLSVIYIDKPLNQNLTFFPYANKNFACAYVEENTNHEVLVFLDSDTLFFHEPSQLLLNVNIDVAVRPVDLKGICTSGTLDDQFDSYWRSLCQLCEVDYDRIPLINTTIDQASIKSCYNGGLVAVRANKSIFRQWRENILRVTRNSLEPVPGNFWGSGQSTLAMAIWGVTESVFILDSFYNYPVHIIEHLPKQKIYESYPIIHIHYHDGFNAENIEKNPIFSQDFYLEDEIKDFLLSRLPLRDKHLTWSEIQAREGDSHKLAGMKDSKQNYRLKTYEANLDYNRDFLEKVKSDLDYNRAFLEEVKSDLNKSKFS